MLKLSEIYCIVVKFLLKLSEIFIKKGVFSWLTIKTAAKNL